MSISGKSLIARCDFRTQTGPLCIWTLIALHSGVILTQECEHDLDNSAGALGDVFHLADRPGPVVPGASERFFIPTGRTYKTQLTALALQRKLTTQEAEIVHHEGYIACALAVCDEKVCHTVIS